MASIEAAVHTAQAHVVMENLKIQSLETSERGFDAKMPQHLLSSCFGE